MVEVRGLVLRLLAFYTLLRLLLGLLNYLNKLRMAACKILIPVGPWKMGNQVEVLLILTHDLIH